jgi:hypothetical protein
VGAVRPPGRRERGRIGAVRIGSERINGAPRRSLAETARKHG